MNSILKCPWTANYFEMDSQKFTFLLKNNNPMQIHRHPLYRLSFWSRQSMPLAWFHASCMSAQSHTMKSKQSKSITPYVFTQYIITAHAQLCVLFGKLKIADDINDTSQVETAIFNASRFPVGNNMLSQSGKLSQEERYTVGYEHLRKTSF